MKIYTSYFYQIRNFPSNLIPLSTAVWDPKWYHQGHDQTFVYKDKNNVWNGLRAEVFVPGTSCENLCKGPDHPEICQKLGDSCQFLENYYNQLKKLSFDQIVSQLSQFASAIQSLDDSKEEYNIALIFHEASDNPCSERVIIRRWFEENGLLVEEFHK